MAKEIPNLKSKDAVEGLRAVAAWNKSGRQEAVDRLTQLAKPSRRESK